MKIFSTKKELQNCWCVAHEQEEQKHEIEFLGRVNIKTLTSTRDLFSKQQETHSQTFSSSFNDTWYTLKALKCRETRVFERKQNQIHWNFNENWVDFSKDLCLFILNFVPSEIFAKRETFFFRASLNILKSFEFLATLRGLSKHKIKFSSHSSSQLIFGSLKTSAAIMKLIGLSTKPTRGGNKAC